jgi:ribose transport system ATP-binding protein
MHLDGKPFAPMHPVSAREAGVAVVYQELTLCLHLSVAENIVLGSMPARAGLVRRGEVRRRAQEALAQLGVNLPLDRPCRELPIAQQQLTEIARALVATGGPPRVLILDEPTSSLTAADVDHLFTVMRRLWSAGTAIILISHALEECRLIADRYVILRDGASVAAGVMAETGEADLIRLMVGRELTELYPPRGAPVSDSAECVLRLDALAGRSRPKSVTLELHRGKIVGLYGLIGAGRTECLRTLFGLDPVGGGRVQVLGRDETRASPKDRLTRGLALLSENRKEEGLCLGRSISDNLVMSHPAPACRLRRAWLPFVPRRAVDLSGHWIEALGIRCRDALMPVSDLSGGNQQKVAMARLLHHLAHGRGEARVLLLDEPTRGIDVGAKATLYRLIREQAAAGTAIILVSSYIPEILGMCDEVAVMRDGRLGSLRSTAGVSAHDLLAEAIG